MLYREENWVRKGFYAIKIGVHLKTVCMMHEDIYIKAIQSEWAMYINACIK